MNIILVGSIVAIILEVCFITYIIINQYRKKEVIGKNTFLYIFPISVILFILYLVAIMGSQADFQLIFIIESFESTFKTLTFEVKSVYVYDLLETNVLYAISFYIAYIIAILTIFGSALGVIREYLFNMINILIITKKDTDIIIGTSETAIEYAKKHRKHSVIWILDDHGLIDKSILRQEKIAYIKDSFNYKNIVKRFKGKSNYNFISFETESDKYQKLIDEVVILSKKHNNFYLFLEVNYNETDVVRDQLIKHGEEKSYFFIRTFSRYQLITSKFISNVTIPKLLPNDFFNLNRSIKDEKEINVFFLGYGKVSGNLFNQFLENNQLVTTTNDKLKAKLVNYYVIDQNDNNTKHNSRHDYVMKNVDRNNKESFDLPNPEPLCNYHRIKGNLYDSKVIDSLSDKVKGKENFSIFIVSFGSDLENIEMSVWLKEKYINENIKIICRSKQMNILDPNIISFGNLQEIITHDNIVNDQLDQLAKDINMEYGRLRNKDVSKFESDWLKLPKIEFFSNYSSAINLYFKLNLLGFNLSKDKNLVSISKEEFLNVYTKDAPNELSYSNYFLTNTKNVIGYGEKLRWNAFYILNGYKQMSLEKLNINSETLVYTRKDEVNKEHVCITSHLGLDQLHKEVVERFKKVGVDIDLMDVELYKYDYMALDNPENEIYDFLIKLGYKITRL